MNHAAVACNNGVDTILVLRNLLFLLFFQNVLFFLVSILLHNLFYPTANKPNKQSNQDWHFQGHCNDSNCYTM